MTEPASTGAVSSNRNIMIVLSYLWLLALVPLLVEKEDREVQWHAKHGIVLMVAEIVLWIAVTIVSMMLGMISMALGCVVSLITFGLWIGILDLMGVWWLIHRRRRVPHVLEVKRNAD